MDTIKTEKTSELVKAEFPRLVTGALGLGKLENINAHNPYNEDICGKDEVLVTIKGSNNANNLSFTVNKEMTECLLRASLTVFIEICQAKGLSAKKEFQELYPALVS